MLLKSYLDTFSDLSESVRCLLVVRNPLSPLLSEVARAGDDRGGRDRARADFAADAAADACAKPRSGSLKVWAFGR